MTWQDFLKSRLATWILGAILIFAMVAAAKILIQKYAVDKEIAKLQAQMEKIKKDNDQLSYLIQYFNTPDYQDKAAREKLNLKKDGEYVVGLPQNADSADSSQTSEEKASNFAGWFNYFFNQPAD